MIDVERLCRGCMRFLPEGAAVCPACGYDREREIRSNGKCLPVDTILHGRYLLGSVLGEGGFGITYIAFDLVEQVAVAIKEYFPVGLASRDVEAATGQQVLVMPGEAGMHYRNGLRRFNQEAENLSRFQELPGIVAIRDFFPENGTAYLVMDFIEGQSLKQYMQWYQQDKGGEPMEYTVALALMEPVMGSLAQIHGAGIIHRDVSPDNILVDKGGQVTLIDFGAARTGVSMPDYRSVTVMVKHGYAPEEQYRTHGSQGPWTDVYALSATLYHMISGTLPMEAVERLYRDELPPLKKLALPTPVPEKISDVIEKGMSVRAENRYQGMEEMYQALKEALQAEKAREEAERQAQEEAERQAREEAEKARKEAERQTREEEAERKAREEAERQAQEKGARDAQEQSGEMEQVQAEIGKEPTTDQSEQERLLQGDEFIQAGDQGGNVYGVLAIVVVVLGIISAVLQLLL